MNMNPSTNQIIQHYKQAYQQLYKRTPSEIQILANDWLIVNGARMQANELQFLTIQLRREIDRESVAQRRQTIRKLLNWFKASD